MKHAPAFPIEMIYTQENEKFNGMTLRDYFAAKAMQNILPILDEKSFTLDPSLKKLVSELPLTVRTARCLEAEEIVHLGDLIQKSETDLLRIPNFGRKCLNEVKEVLELMELGLNYRLEGWTSAKQDIFFEGLASAAYKMADAMLKAREA
jgi:DNA-directed RNA polymerase alpha subunit